MTINETYNIHKIINCMLPHFKSKWLCKREKHNYQIYCCKKKKEYVIFWKCNCCGKKEKFED